MRPRRARAKGRLKPNQVRALVPVRDGAQVRACIHYLDQYLKLPHLRVRAEGGWGLEALHQEKFERFLAPPQVALRLKVQEQAMERRAVLRQMDKPEGLIRREIVILGSVVELG